MRPDKHITNSVPARDNATSLGRILHKQWDLLFLMALLVFANRTLLWGAVNHALIYHPVPVLAGEWWRLLSYPWVHLSWYHLLLDAGAFYLLYTGLTEKRGAIRLTIIAACSASSLLFGVVLGAAQDIGLAGLSGIDHGLMAVISLEMIRTSRRRNLGLACFALVLAKCVYEIATGEAVFASLHIGLCGIPVVATHAGGLFGGVLAFGTFYTYQTLSRIRPTSVQIG